MVSLYVQSIKNLLNPKVVVVVKTEANALNSLVLNHSEIKNENVVILAKRLVLPINQVR